MARPAGYEGWSRQRRSRHWAQRRRARSRQDRRYDRDPLYNPAAQLTGAALKRAVDQIVEAELGPQIGATRRAERSAEAQGAALGQRVGSYYEGLAREAAGQEARSRALSRALEGRVASSTEQARQGVTAAEQAARSSAAEDASYRGGGLEGGGRERVAAELAARRANVEETGQSAATTAQNIGANYEGLMRALAGARAARGGEVQGQIANRTANEMRDLRGRRTDLEASRGPMTAKALQELRQRGFENLATARTLDIKTADLEAESQQEALDRALAERRLSEQERANRADENIAREAEQGRDTRSRRNQQNRDGRGRREAEASRKGRQTIEAVRQYYATAQSRHPEWQLREVARRARRDITADELLIAAGADLATKGYLPEWRIRQLRNAGIRVPRAWVRRRGTSRPPNSGGRPT